MKGISRKVKNVYDVYGEILDNKFVNYNFPQKDKKILLNYHNKNGFDTIASITRIIKDDEKEIFEIWKNNGYEYIINLLFPNFIISAKKKECLLKVEKTLKPAILDAIKNGYLPSTAKRTYLTNILFYIGVKNLANFLNISTKKETLNHKKDFYWSNTDNVVKEIIENYSKNKIINFSIVNKDLRNYISKFSKDAILNKLIEKNFKVVGKRSVYTKEDYCSSVCCLRSKNEMSIHAFLTYNEIKHSSNDFIDKSVSCHRTDFKLFLKNEIYYVEALGYEKNGSSEFNKKYNERQKEKEKLYENKKILKIYCKELNKLVANFKIKEQYDFLKEIFYCLFEIRDFNLKEYEEHYFKSFGYSTKQEAIKNQILEITKNNKKHFEDKYFPTHSFLIENGHKELIHQIKSVFHPNPFKKCAEYCELELDNRYYQRRAKSLQFKNEIFTIHKSFINQHKKPSSIQISCKSKSTAKKIQNYLNEAIYDLKLKSNFTIKSYVFKKLKITGIQKEK